MYTKWLCSKYGKNTWLELYKPSEIKNIDREQNSRLYTQYFSHHLGNKEKELFELCLIIRNKQNEKRETLERI